MKALLVVIFVFSNCLHCHAKYRLSAASSDLAELNIAMGACAMQSALEYTLYHSIEISPKTKTCVKELHRQLDKTKNKLKNVYLKEGEKISALKEWYIEYNMLVDKIATHPRDAEAIQKELDKISDHFEAELRF